jgi:hypothetical protein
MLNFSKQLFTNQHDCTCQDWQLQLTAYRISMLKAGAKQPSKTIIVWSLKSTFIFNFKLIAFAIDIK